MLFSQWKKKEESDIGDLHVERGVEKKVTIDYKVKPKKKTAIVFASLLSLFFMGYTAKNIIFPKNGMYEVEE